MQMCQCQLVSKVCHMLCVPLGYAGGGGGGIAAVCGVCAAITADAYVSAPPVAYDSVASWLVEALAARGLPPGYLL
jgi:hypothetical protein